MTFRRLDRGSCDDAEAGPGSPVGSVGKGVRRLLWRAGAAEETGVAVCGGGGGGTGEGFACSAARLAAERVTLEDMRMLWRQRRQLAEESHRNGARQLDD